MSEFQIPDPPRPLGAVGLTLWQTCHQSGPVRGHIEALVLLCEQIDERTDLRMEVIQTKDWRQRAALRALETLIDRSLRDMNLRPILTPADDVRPEDWTTRLARVYKSGDGVIREWTDAEWAAKQRRFDLDNDEGVGDERR
jgi:hypothetical protein